MVSCKDRGREEGTQEWKEGAAASNGVDCHCLDIFMRYLLFPSNCDFGSFRGSLGWSAIWEVIEAVLDDLN